MSYDPFVEVDCNVEVDRNQGTSEPNGSLSVNPEAISPEPAPPESAKRSTAAAMLAAVAQLQTGLEDERKRAEASRTEVAAQLQAVLLVNKTLAELVEENHQLRSGEHEKVLEPVLRDLVSLAEDLNGLLANAGHPSLQTAVSLLTEVLARYGAVEVRPEPLDRFDPSLHNGVARLPTKDKTLDGVVAELLSPGYRNTRTFLLYPRVKVYRHLAG